MLKQGPSAGQVASLVGRGVVVGLSGRQVLVEAQHVGGAHRQGLGLRAGVFVVLQGGVEQWPRCRTLKQFAGPLIESAQHCGEVGGTSAGAEQCSADFAIAVEEGLAAGDDLLVADGEQTGEDRFGHVVEQPRQPGFLDCVAVGGLESVGLSLHSDDLKGLALVVG